MGETRAILSTLRPPANMKMRTPFLDFMQRVVNCRGDTKTLAVGDYQRHERFNRDRFACMFADVIEDQPS